MKTFEIFQGWWPIPKGRSVVTLMAAALLYASLLGAVRAQQTSDTTLDSTLPWWELNGDATISALVAASQAATSDVIASQSLVGNAVTDGGAGFRASINDSFNDSSGLLGINQSAGELNNQANVRALSLVLGGGGTILAAQASAVMTLTENSLDAAGPRTAHLDSSFNNTSGVVGVNQVAGNLNQQLNILAFSFGRGPDLLPAVVGDTTLATVGDAKDNKLVKDSSIAGDAGMSDSFNGFSGIAQVSLMAGDLNRVANILAVTSQVVGSQ